MLYLSHLALVICYADQERRITGGTIQLNDTSTLSFENKILSGSPDKAAKKSSLRQVPKRNKKRTRRPKKNGVSDSKSHESGVSSWGALKTLGAMGIPLLALGAVFWSGNMLKSFDFFDYGDANSWDVQVCVLDRCVAPFLGALKENYDPNFASSVDVYHGVSIGKIIGETAGRLQRFLTAKTAHESAHVMDLAQGQRSEVASYLSNFFRDTMRDLLMIEKLSAGNSEEMLRGKIGLYKRNLAQLKGIQKKVKTTILANIIRDMDRTVTKLEKLSRQPADDVEDMLEGDGAHECFAHENEGSEVDEAATLQERIDQVESVFSDENKKINPNPSASEFKLKYLDGISKLYYDSVSELEKVGAFKREVVSDEKSVLGRLARIEVNALADMKMVKIGYLLQQSPYELKIHDLRTFLIRSERMDALRRLLPDATPGSVEETLIHRFMADDLKFTAEL